MRSNAGCDCCGALPRCQSLNTIKFALPAQFLRCNLVTPCSRA
jgi:hypothetical protein